MSEPFHWDDFRLLNGRNSPKNPLYLDLKAQTDNRMDTEQNKKQRWWIYESFQFEKGSFLEMIETKETKFSKADLIYFHAISKVSSWIGLIIQNLKNHGQIRIDMKRNAKKEPNKSTRNGKLQKFVGLYRLCQNEENIEVVCLWCKHTHTRRTQDTHNWCCARAQKVSLCAIHIK